MSEATTLRRKRLAFRSRYRGVLESDLLFEQFAATHLAGLSETQLDRYEALLDESDADLLAWVAGRRPVPARHDNDVFDLLRKLELNT